MYTQEKNLIVARTESFVKAWNQGKPQAMAAAYVDDGRLIDPFGQDAQGRATIEQLFEQTLSSALKGSNTTISVEQIRFVKPDVAFVDGTQTLTGVVSPDGAAVPELRFHVAATVLKKEESWYYQDVRVYAFSPPPPTE